MVSNAISIRGRTHAIITWAPYLGWILEKLFGAFVESLVDCLLL
jgi:hypothetical protein